ncbi:MAG TPA: metalloregulator ArsR/SmtB family transcription factor [Thermomicrobiales bacterium]|nr:metalloregulator ArsR/SmtB family transcription factor [Thermomicrobiales bacterium]
MCDDEVVHLDRVRAAQGSMPHASGVDGMSALFAALGDPTRLRIVAALAGDEMCVCDIAAALGVSTSAVSHQLRVLRGRGLVRPRRAGRLVYYALDDDHVRVLYQQALDHIGHGAAS